MPGTIIPGGSRVVEAWIASEDDGAGATCRFGSAIAVAVAAALRGVSDAATRPVRPARLVLGSPARVEDDGIFWAWSVRSSGDGSAGLAPETRVVAISQLDAAVDCILRDGKILTDGEAGSLRRNAAQPANAIIDAKAAVTNANTAACLPVRAAGDSRLNNSRSTVDADGAWVGCS